MSEEDDEWKSLSVDSKLYVLRREMKEVRAQLKQFKTLLMNAALGAFGILFFQVLPYIQAIGKVAK